MDAGTERLPEASDLGGVDLRATLRFLAILGGDPTVRLDDSGFERSTITPDGPGVVTIDWSHPSVAVRTFGSGNHWLAQRLEGLLGLDDDPTGFEPTAPPIRDLWRRSAGLRVPRTRTVWHDLSWLVLQQRVSYSDAADQWRALVRTFGEPAPAPATTWFPPDPRQIAALSYSDLHRCGIERSRAETLIRCAKEIPRLEHRVDGSYPEIERRLASLHGIGPWTRAGLESVTWGSADAVPIGDAGIPHMVTWALAGERRGSDQRMLELLEPFRPHRYRVIQLLFLAGGKPPRRAPRGARSRVQDL